MEGLLADSGFLLWELQGGVILSCVQRVSSSPSPASGVSAGNPVVMIA